MAAVVDRSGIERVHAARDHTLTMLPQVAYVRSWPPTLT